MDAIVAIIVATIAGVPGLVSGIAALRAAKANAASQTDDGLQKLVKTYREEVDRVRNELDDERKNRRALEVQVKDLSDRIGIIEKENGHLKDLNHELMTGTGILVAQVRECGQAPRYIPPK